MECARISLVARKNSRFLERILEPPPDVPRACPAQSLGDLPPGGGPHSSSLSAGSSRQPPVQNRSRASRTRASQRPSSWSAGSSRQPPVQKRRRASRTRASQRPASSSAGSSRQPPVQKRGRASRTRASPRSSQSLRDLPRELAALARRLAVGYGLNDVRR
jgi:hypothetical protein